MPTQLPLSLAPLADRARWLIDGWYGGSVNRAAQAIGRPVTQRTLARVVAGEIKNPRSDIAAAIAHHFCADLGWLIRGEGAQPRIPRSFTARVHYKDGWTEEQLARYIASYAQLLEMHIREGRHGTEVSLSISSRIPKETSPQQKFADALDRARRQKELTDIASLEQLNACYHRLRRLKGNE